MPRNKSEKDPERAAIMAYGRLCQASVGAEPGHASILNRLDAYRRLPYKASNWLAGTCKVNLALIIAYYGGLDAA